MKKAKSSGGNASQVQMEPVENQIIVYQPNETVRLDVRLENETVWLTGECCQCENVAVTTPCGGLRYILSHCDMRFFARYTKA